MDMSENTDKRDSNPLDPVNQPRDPCQSAHSEEFEHLVDARGMACPLPLLKMKQTLNKAELEEVIHVITTDSASKRDFAAYIKMTNHLMKTDEKDNQYLFWITKKA